MIDPAAYQLTIEQDFELSVMSRQIAEMPREVMADQLVKCLRQITIQGNIINHLVNPKVTGEEYAVQKNPL